MEFDWCAIAWFQLNAPYYAVTPPNNNNNSNAVQRNNDPTDKHTQDIDFFEKYVN